MRKKVYLAGPITGLTYGGASDWRETVKFDLDDVGIDGYSPLRGKNYLNTGKTLQDTGYEKTLLSSERSIVARDRNDCQTADLIIFNFLGAQKVSIGSCIEVGWADAFRTPAILVIEDEGNFHDYSMIRQICGWRVNNLDDAVYVAKAILLP